MKVSGWAPKTVEIHGHGSTGKNLNIRTGIQENQTETAAI